MNNWIEERPGQFLREQAEKPNEFALRIGIDAGTFSRKVKRPDCPQNFECTEGATGRIISLRASKELEHFMRTDPRSTAQ